MIIIGFIGLVIACLSIYFIGYFGFLFLVFIGLLAPKKKKVANAQGNQTRN